MGSYSDPQLPSDLGFVGLGNMGFPMFSNLVSKLPPTTTVHFYDVNPDSVERGLKESGAVAKLDPCKSSRETAEKSVRILGRHHPSEEGMTNRKMRNLKLTKGYPDQDVFISMVPEGKHVRAVYLDPENGVLAANDLSGKILIDSSTIDTATSLEVGEETKKRHPRASFFDAPVSGGTAGAKKGSITFMIGCAESDPHLPLLKRLMSLMGHNIYTCGGPSLGLTAKFCNNYLSSSITLLNAEMFNFAIKSGMDPRTLQEILKTTTGCNRNAQWANPVPGLSPDAPSSKNYKPGFKIEYVKKDIGLAIAACERVGAKLCLGPTTWNSYVEAGQDPKCAGMDSKVIYRWIGGDEEWKEKFSD